MAPQSVRRYPADTPTDDGDPGATGSSTQKMAPDDGAPGSHPPVGAWPAGGCPCTPVRRAHRAPMRFRDGAGNRQAQPTAPGEAVAPDGPGRSARRSAAGPPGQSRAPCRPLQCGPDLRSRPESGMRPPRRSRRPVCSAGRCRDRHPGPAPGDRGPRGFPPQGRRGPEAQSPTRRPLPQSHPRPRPPGHPPATVRGAERRAPPRQVRRCAGRPPRASSAGSGCGSWRNAGVRARTRRRRPHRRSPR